MHLIKREIVKDRLTFTIFLSCSLHAAILIGLGFEFFQKRENEPIQVTLLQKKINRHPVSPKNMTSPPNIKFKSQSESLHTNSNESMDLVEMIEDLQAQFTRQREAYNQRPQRHTISTVSALNRQQRLYLENWREQIEKIGNLNYPEQARRDKIFGSLRILVAIQTDGQLEEVRILKSSGSEVLDSAAKSIVLLAAPFDPLPEAIRSEADILEIIRTWRFHKGSPIQHF